MSNAPTHVPFDEFVSDASTVFDEVVRSDHEIIVERDGDLFSIRRKRSRRARGRHQLTPNNPLFDMIGIGHSDRSDVSTRKHEYLVDAFNDG